MKPKTLFEKVWEQHEVVPETADTPAVLYIDLHLIHEVTTPQAFAELRSQGLQVRRPDRTLATLDHSTPTDPAEVFGRVPIKVESAARQVQAMEKNCREFGIELLGLGSEQRGIVHVIGPELGATQPGKTIVCGDSHTATHGAFGALAFGIGTTEVGHVLATQCLLQRRPKTLAIEVTGRLREAVTAKDLILAIIGKIGVSGGTGQVIEYRGSAIEALSMDERMTVCNMSIEAGARAGMIAPDETTFAYLKGRRFAPQGDAWDRAVERWRNLRTDAGARYDRVVEIDASKLEPMITYGTNPGMVVPITGSGAGSPERRRSREVALVHGTARRRAAARQTRCRSCSSAAARTRDCPIWSKPLACCAVARSQAVFACWWCRARSRSSAKPKRAGWTKVFTDAGAEWRESGCSMCIGMNGDLVGEGPVRGKHEQPQLRRPPGRRCANVAREPADCCRRGGRRAESPIPREFLEVVTMQPIRTLELAHGRAAVHEHRHGPDHPRAVSHDDDEGRPGQPGFRGLALRRQRRAEAGLRAQPAGGRRLRDSRRRAQFRLRLLARARALGVAGFRLPRRRQHRDRRHLPQQFAQERPAADRRRRADSRLAAGAIPA